MKRTFAGIPLESSLDAPKDKIVTHPDVIAQIEAAALRFSTCVTVTDAGAAAAAFTAFRDSAFE